MVLQNVNIVTSNNGPVMNRYRYFLYLYIPYGKLTIRTINKLNYIYFVHYFPVINYLTFLSFSIKYILLLRLPTV